MDIGQRIKEARLAKGLTQEELGKIIGVQKSAIAKYENGRVVNIKRSNLKKIAEVLELRPSELIIGDDAEESSELHARILTDNGLMNLISEFLLLSDEDKEAVERIIISLRKKQL